MRRLFEEYPLTKKLCHLSVCIPITSVQCEHGFSLQSELRPNLELLTLENLDMLMKLSVDPYIDAFPYEKAIRHWHREKRRRLAILYTSSKE